MSHPSNAAVVKESLNVVYLNVSPSGVLLSREENLQSNLPMSYQWILTNGKSSLEVKQNIINQWIKKISREN